MCNKVIDEFRKRTSAKHNIDRVQPNGSNTVTPADVAGDDVTPSQVAVAREHWNRLIQGQPSHYQQILELRLAGLTYNEIAQQVQIHERTARRVIDNLLREHDSMVSESQIRDA